MFPDWQRFFHINSDTPLKIVRFAVISAMLLRLLSVIGAGLLASGAYAQQQQPASTASGSLVRQLNDAFADVYEKVAPAVVVIEVQRESDEAGETCP